MPDATSANHAFIKPPFFIDAGRRWCDTRRRMNHFPEHVKAAARRTDRIPSAEECRAIMNRYGMLDNIVEHSEQVMRVSLAITDDLIDAGAVDRDLIIASSLLHDITKTRSLATKERHDLSGGELLRSLGFDRIAYIVEQHVYFTEFDPAGAIEEREIVYYADKRVMHSEIVTVEQRVRDLVDRYGTTPERSAIIVKNKELVQAMERKINRFMRGDINLVITALTQP